MSVYVGLDIGGTKLLVAAVDAAGRERARRQADTPAPLQEGLDLLHRLIDEMRGGEDVAGLGAAIGGPLDWRTGVVSPLHQPAWREVPLKAIMEARWGCPFAVDVDTNVAALAEYRHGGARADRFLYMTVSTGIGGGFLVDGTLYRGLHGAHPEIGHQAVPLRCRHPERVHCECGVPDCLEAVASGNGIQRVYGKKAQHLDADEWAEVAWHLGQGLRNLAAIYAPEVIALGGGVAVGGGEPLLQAIRQILADHLRLVPLPEVRLSTLGYETALQGALSVARYGLE
jgi:predicted NBD/HSP70 family sugar kinase